MKKSLSLCLLLLAVSLWLPLPVTAATAPATIAVLSHTDFLPDVTKVYGRRSSNAHEKRGDRIGRSISENSAGDGAENAMEHDGMVEAVTADPTLSNLRLPHGVAPETVGLPEPIADALIEQLAAGGRFKPVERKALRTALLEQRFGEKMEKFYAAMREKQEGEAGFEEKKFYTLLRDFQDLGQSVGARWLVVGNLQQLGTTTGTVPLPYGSRTVTSRSRQARMKLRVVDTRSGTVSGAASVEVDLPTPLLSADTLRQGDFPFLDTIGRLAAGKVLDLIYPAQLISETPPIISRGSRDGVHTGDRLTLIHVGRELQEADGTTITHLQTPAGEARVVSTQERVATVELLDGELHRGDLVRFESASTPPALTPSAAGGELAELDAVPEKSARRTLAVITPLFTVPDNTCLKKREVVNRLTDALTVSLDTSRRFTLYERKDVDRPMDEKIFQAITSGSSLEILLKEFAGADLLLLGQIEYFGTTSRIEEIPYLDELGITHQGVAAGLFKIVDSHTGEVITAEKVRLEMKYRDEPRRTAETRLLDSFARKAADGLLKRLFPMKILGLGEENTIYLNRGEDGGVTLHRFYTVKRAGKPLSDPDTGIAMGSTETTIGTLQIIGVEPFRARGIMVEGGPPQKGDLLFPAAPAAAEKKMQPTW